MPYRLEKKLGRNVKEFTVYSKEELDRIFGGNIILAGEATQRQAELDEALDTLNNTELPELTDRLGRLNEFLNDPESLPDGTTYIEDSLLVDNIWTGSITALEGWFDKITANQLFVDKLVANEVFADTGVFNQIFTDTLTASEITTLGLWTDELIAENILADKITANEILANTITASEIDVNNLFSQQITIGTGGYITSSGYNPADPVGTRTGFRINADGTADFQEVTVKGNIVSGSTIDSTVIEQTVKDIVSGANTFQTVGEGDNVTFGDVVVSGTINYQNEENLQVVDKTITLNKGATLDSEAENAGIIIERPSGNLTMLWDSTDGFVFNDNIKASGAEFSGNLIISGTSDLQGDVDFTTEAVSKAGFNSGFAGSGTQIDFANDYIETTDMTVRGSMRIYELIINQIRATNGSLWVSSAAKIEDVQADTPSAGEYTITLGEDTYVPFLKDDLIRAQRFQKTNVAGVYVLEGTVVSVDNSTNPPTFVMTLEAGSDVPTVGMDLVRIGNTDNVDRQGAVYLTSDDSGAPYIDIINDVNSHNAFQTQATFKARFGNLEGIVDTSVGLNNTQTYGLYSDSAYLKGTIVANAGEVANWSIIGNEIKSETATAGIALNSSDPSFVMSADFGSGLQPVLDINANAPAPPQLEVYDSGTRTGGLSIDASSSTTSFYNAFTPLDAEATVDTEDSNVIYNYDLDLSGAFGSGINLIRVVLQGFNTGDNVGTGIAVKEYDQAKIYNGITTSSFSGQFVSGNIQDFDYHRLAVFVFKTNEGANGGTININNLTWEETNTTLVVNSQGIFKRIGSSIVEPLGSSGVVTTTVSSVFGRTGDISAQSGDYSFSQISGASTYNISNFNNNAGYYSANDSPTFNDATVINLTARNIIDVNRSSSGRALELQTLNQDIDFRIGNSNDLYGFYWRYKGTDAGNDNDLELWSENQTGPHVQVYNIKQDGSFELYTPLSGTSATFSGEVGIYGNFINFITGTDARIQVTDSNPFGTGAEFIFWGDGVANNATVQAEVFRATSDIYVASQILHDGDTNTYMQFHSGDQWRVVTGGAERLEVNNSQVTVQNYLTVNGGGLFTGAFSVNGKAKLQSAWSSSDLTANSFYSQNATDGFAMGHGTGVSTWFSWDSTNGQKRAIDVWNDGSRVDIGQGGATTVAMGDLHISGHNGTILSSASSNDNLRVRTNTGYVDIGPRNSGWAHFATDRGQFYFGEEVHVNGQIRVYNTNTYLNQTSGYINGNEIWHDGNLPNPVQTDENVSFNDVLLKGNLLFNGNTSGDYIGYATQQGITYHENGTATWRLSGNGENFINGGNLGIGDPTPSYKLDVNGTGRFRDNLIAGGLGVRDNGGIWKSESTNSNESVVHFLSPDNNMWRRENNSSDGQIVIKFESTSLRRMMSGWIDVHEYNTNKSYSIYFSGYTIPGTPDRWINPTVKHIGGSEGTDKAEVNFCIESDGRFSIRLGRTTSTNWDYPHVVVRDVTFGYDGGSEDIDNIINSIYLSTSSASITDHTFYPTMRSDKNRWVGMFQGNDRIAVTSSGIDVNGEANAIIVSKNGTEVIAENEISFSGTGFSIGQNWRWLSGTDISVTKSGTDYTISYTGSAGGVVDELRDDSGFGVSNSFITMLGGTSISTSVAPNSIQFDYTGFSDRTLKDDWQGATLGEYHDRFMNLEAGSYLWKEDKYKRVMYDPTGRSMGMIAQDFIEQFPELGTESNNTFGINYPMYAGSVLTNELQFAHHRIDDTETEIESLKNQIAELQSKVKTLEASA